MKVLFQINDMVLYSIYGICKIIDITKRDLCGKPMEYYVLQQIYDNKSMLFIPTHNSELTAKMKEILSPSEIYSMIRLMPHEKTIWIQNEALRKQKYAEILKNGDRAELIRMIKTLYLHKKSQIEKGKKMHVADERFLNEAEKLLHEEFAHVLHIKREQVLPFIFEQIKIDERTIADNEV